MITNLRMKTLILILLVGIITNIVFAQNTDTISVNLKIDNKLIDIKNKFSIVIIDGGNKIKLISLESKTVIPVLKDTLSYVLFKYKRYKLEFYGINKKLLEDKNNREWIFEYNTKPEDKRYKWNCWSSYFYKSKTHHSFRRIGYSGGKVNYFSNCSFLKNLQHINSPEFWSAEIFFKVFFLFRNHFNILFSGFNILF